MNACRVNSELTAQSAPAGGEASPAAGDWLELAGQADGRHGVAERQRSFQLEQHDVVAGLARRTAVLGVRNDLDNAHAHSDDVRLADVVQSDHDIVRVRAGAIPVSHHTTSLCTLVYTPGLYLF